MRKRDLLLAEYRKKTNYNLKQPKKCHVCNKLFHKTYSLTRHMLLHTGEKPFKCPHAPCNFAFIQKSDLQRHVAVHFSVRRFVCNFKKCQKRFRTKRNRHSHQVNTHLRTGPNYSCKVCHKEFKFLNTLKLHDDKMHIQSKKYECDWCGKCFLIKPYLRSHFKRHLVTGVRFKPKNHTNFIHPRYEKHLPEGIITQEKPDQNRFSFDEEDQNKFPLNVEALIEEYEIIQTEDIKQEIVDDQMFIDYEICPMDDISGVIKEETEDDDRDFLQAFLPRMSKMSEDEKKVFKRKAKHIAKKVLAMRF